MKNLLIGVGVMLSAWATAQDPNGGPINTPSEGVVDGVYIQTHVPTKRLIPYEYVREADVIWSKKVWQYIDLREKINLPMYYPLDEITPSGEWVKNSSRWSLWTVIRYNIINGYIHIYSPYNPLMFGLGSWDGDQLKYPVNPSIPGGNFTNDSLYRTALVTYLGRLGAQSDTPLTDENGDPIIITDPVTGAMEYKYPPRDTVWLTSQDIVQYRIKEEWFFDKERSVLDQRIIAIAPVVYKVEEDGQGNKTIGKMMELFWLYYPECRFAFNNYFVYNEKNDAQWMSFDDLFWKRRFSSVIYKESNAYDRTVDSYKTGVDALMEAEKLKEEIRTIEHDVWSF